MKKTIINKIMTYIDKKKKLSQEEKEVIIYGIESIYILVTKLIIIFAIAILLGIFKELLIFLLLFNVIRTFAFGLHATKSSICLVVSTLVFLLLPFVATKIDIPFLVKIIVGFILIILIFKNSPADTHKRPIISKKRRRFFKITSTIIAIIYVLISLITNRFISNCLIFSLLLESIFISPLVYKLFKLPYNNYLKYIEKEEKNVIC